MYGNQLESSDPQKSEGTRAVSEIVEQLHELLQIKRSALANAQGDFADSVLITSILRQEKALHTELRAALGPVRRATKRKKTG
jgi:hypothetical protein